MSYDVGEAMEGVGGGGSLLSPTLPSHHLRQSSFSSLANPSVVSSTSQLIIQPFCHFTYITTCSPTLLSLHLRHMHFTYVTWRAIHEPNHPQNQILDTPVFSNPLSLHLRHMHFIYVTWRAIHEPDPPQNQILDMPVMQKHTIDNIPGASCFKLKFSSVNVPPPYTLITPVPSPCKIKFTYSYIPHYDLCWLQLRPDTFSSYS